MLPFVFRSGRSTRLGYIYQRKDSLSGETGTTVYRVCVSQTDTTAPQTVVFACMSSFGYVE